MEGNCAGDPDVGGVPVNRATAIGAMAVLLWGARAVHDLDGQGATVPACRNVVHRGLRPGAGEMDRSG